MKIRSLNFISWGKRASGNVQISPDVVKMIRKEDDLKLYIYNV